MIEWSKSNAAGMKRILSTPTFKDWIEMARDRHPKISGVKTLEEAALIGAIKEGREQILQELLDSAEWNEQAQDAGQNQEPL